MRQITEYCTKSLLPLALVCSFLFAGCQGSLTDDELKMALLNSGDKGVGMTLLSDEEEEGVNSEEKALIGTWLDVYSFKDDWYWYVGGFVFSNDGLYEIDEELNGRGEWYGIGKGTSLGPIDASGPSTDQLRTIINAAKAEGPDATWSVRGNIITATESWVSKSGEVEIEIWTWKYVLNGNTLMLYEEFVDEYHHADDADGDGYADEPDWILTKYNL